jgi:hypothetical protein
VPPGNELYAIEGVDSGERVGDLWFAERDNDAGEKSLYVYSVEISPELRGRASAARRCWCSRTRRAGEG